MATHRLPPGSMSPSRRGELGFSRGIFTKSPSLLGVLPQRMAEDRYPVSLDTGGYLSGSSPYQMSCA